MAIKNLNPSPEDKLIQSLEQKQAQAKSNPVQTPAAETIKPTTESSINESTDQSTDPSMDQSVDEPTAQLIGPPVDRSVAFYIPKVIHKKIDEAVLYYQEKRSKRIDRSAVVAALLADPEIWTHKSLDQLAGKVVRQLTHRLID